MFVQRRLRNTSLPVQLKVLTTTVCISRMGGFRPTKGLTANSLFFLANVLLFLAGSGVLVGWQH